MALRSQIVSQPYLSDLEMIQAKRFPILRIIALIVAAVGIAIYLFWLQRYTFTDRDVEEMFGAKIFRTTIEAKEGQELFFGKSVDGLRSQYVTSPTNVGRTNLVVALWDEGEWLSLIIKSGLKGRITHQSPVATVNSRVSRFRIDKHQTDWLSYAIIKESDGTVWLAEWEEETDGQKKRVRFGYWLK